MKKDYSKIVNYILLLLGLAILFIFIKTSDFKTLKDSLRLAGFRVIFSLFILMLITVVLKAYRWQLLIKKITGKNISLWFSFLSIFAGVSSASIFPGRNEVTKPLMLKTAYKAELSKTIPAALIEKMFDFISVVALFLLALVFVQGVTSDYNKYVAPFIIVIMLLFLSLFIFPAKLSKIFLFIINKLPLSKQLKLKTAKLNTIFFQSFSVLKEKKASFAFFLLSFIAVIIEVIRVSFLFWALGMPITPVTAALAFNGALLIAIITLIPGGVGVTEFSAAFIIKNLATHLELNNIRGAIFIDRIVSYYFIIGAGALILLFYRKLIKRG